MLAITKETGEILNLILRLKDAKNMLEIGTSTGYSTIWCAEALLENNGRIVTIEKNPDKIQRAKKNFEDAGVSSIIEIKQGEALKILSEISSDQKFKDYFDFVLIDADKENVIEYFDLISSIIKIGGVIVTDNMLYPEKYRVGMKKLSDHIKMKPNFHTKTIGIGNGEEVTIRLS